MSMPLTFTLALKICLKEKAVLQNLGIYWGDDSSSDVSVDNEILNHHCFLEKLDVGEITKLVKDSLLV